MWSFSETDFQEYRNSLQNMEWNSLLNDDPNSSCLHFTNSIISTANNHIPNKIVTFRPCDPPWMNNDLRKSIRKRKRFHTAAKKSKSATDWAKYRKMRNITVNKTRNVRQTYYSKLAEKIKSSDLSPNQWWKTLKQITANNTYTKQTYPPMMDINNNLPINDNVEKADLFNKYFSSQSTLDDEDLDVETYIQPTNQTTLSEIILSAQDVKDTLCNLNVNKATGPDDINPNMLKQAANVLAEPTSKLFNLSLNRSIFPDLWKIAHVIPVHKKGPKCVFKISIQLSPR
jgi:hypothetical protein